MEKNNLIYASDAFLSSFRANAIHVMKMCNAFSKYFNRVTLYCHEWSENDDVYDKYGVSKGFSIKSSNIRLPSWLSLRIQILLSSFFNAWSINRCVNKDIVYCRSTLTVFFLFKSTEFIYEVHATANSWLFQKIEKYILKRKSLQYLVTINQPLKNKYLETYPFLNSNQVIVLHDGADRVNDFQSKIELRKKDGYIDCVKIGYIGSLYKGKCMEVLLPIAKVMNKQLFHVVGGSPEWVNYWQEESNKVAVGNIIFYGMINPGDVGLFYNSFDICILPYSRNIYVDKNNRLNIGMWISPLKLFEAMSFGKAIVVSDLQTIREVMNDKTDCYLLNPDDINSWIVTLNKLISSVEERTTLGTNGRIKFESFYSWQKRAQYIYNQIKE